MLQKIVVRLIFSLITILACFNVLLAQPMNFRNTELTLDQRVDALAGELTTAEKISLLGYNNQGVPHLGIPVYNWWNEALHGVARAGEATVFPQAIAMAATFNDQLIHQILWYKIRS